MAHPSWKQTLEQQMSPRLCEEIDAFESQMNLRRQGKMEERLFAETRLRRGVYGQRYDNGQRHDGTQTQSLRFPCGDLTKGPETIWDAPGMVRIKIPFGAMTAEQMDVLAGVAEEYSDSILHITTRQDIQLHFVHIDDTPDLMRRLAAVGITTREACGNSVRNVTACPIAGVCHTEAFDVSPYALALTQYLLGHPDVQDFGRKFKIAFSGCKTEACGLVNFHDMGAIAAVRTIDGKHKRGFELYVGGGLGSVPHEAKLLEAFCPEEELLPMAQAVSRVFARLGEKNNRAKARIKFLVRKLGIDEFRRLVLEERAKLPADPRWTAFLSDLKQTDEHPLKRPSAQATGKPSDAFAAWRKTNVHAQRQEGYSAITVTLPLGDLASVQMRGLADIARRYTGDTVRTTVEQNVVYRWVSNSDLPAFYEELSALGLGDPGAGTISDITACPGTDTCKLGIASSRGVADVLRRRLQVTNGRDEAVEHLRIKASGCFNSCGQHHVADIGFLGVSRQVGGRRVPHFQLVVGGEWTNNAGAFGLGVGAIPSKAVPAAVDKLTQLFLKERQDGEAFHGFVARVGKARIRKELEAVMKVPAYEVDPSYYADWGDPREYAISDMGVGECAGEVVPFVQFGLAAAERQVFEAQDLLEKGDAAGAVRRAFAGMIDAAKALVRHREIIVADAPDEVVAKFRQHFYDSKLFFDPYAGGKFAHYFFKAHAEQQDAGKDRERAHHQLEEAQLFIEACHACYERMGAEPQATPA